MERIEVRIYEAPRFVGLPFVDYYHQYFVYFSSTGDRFVHMVPDLVPGSDFRKLVVEEGEFVESAFPSVTSDQVALLAEASDLSAVWQTINETLDAIEATEVVWGGLENNSNTAVATALAAAADEHPEVEFQAVNFGPTYPTPGSESTFDTSGNVQGELLIEPWDTPAWFGQQFEPSDARDYSLVVTADETLVLVEDGTGSGTVTVQPDGGGPSTTIAGSEVLKFGDGPDGLGILAPLYSPDDDEAAVIVSADGSGKIVISEGVEHTFDAGARIDFVVDATGDETDNIFVGNGEANVIAGGQGNDIVVAGFGHDDLFGDAGNDFLYGGMSDEEDDGADYIEGGDGDDMLFGGSGPDYLVSTAGNDVLDGGRGNDYLESSSDQGTTYVFGPGYGHDFVANLLMVAKFWPFEVVVAADRPDFNTCAGPVPRLTDTILFQDLAPEDLILEWDVTHLTGQGGQWNDKHGEAAIRIAGSEDTLYIGWLHYFWHDTDFPDGSLFYLPEADEFLADPNCGNQTAMNVPFLQFDDGQPMSLEEVFDLKTIDATPLPQSYVSALQDFNAARSAGEQIAGTSGNDTLIGTAGNDTIDGAGGADVIDGLAGNDVITGGAGDDVITGSAGDDDLSGGEGDDEFLYDGAGNGFDSVDGGPGTDSIVGSGGDDVIGLSSLVNVEAVLGGAGTDRIEGSDGADTLDFRGMTFSSIEEGINAGSGDDTLDFGGTAHIVLPIDAGSGEDTLNFSGAISSISEVHAGSGNDILDFSGVTGTVDNIEWIDAGSDNDTLNFSGISATNVEWIDAGSGNDTLNFSGSTIINISQIDAGSDDDTLNFSGISATFIGWINAGSGDDTLNFSGSTTIISQIDGGPGNDTLDLSGITIVFGPVVDGGSGDDTIISSTANDTLYGGDGSDTFVFRDGDGRDVIADFQAGAGTDDVVDLSGVAGVSDFADIVALAVQNGNDVRLDFGNGDRIDLAGVALSEIHADDFRFA